jgi:hypothetical protein
VDWQNTASYNLKFFRHKLAILAAITLVAGLGNTCRRQERGTYSEQSRTRFKSVAQSFRLEPTSFEKQLSEFTIAPHPFGSGRQREVASFVKETAAPFSERALLDEFDSSIPNPELLKNPQAPAPLTLPIKGVNVHAAANVSMLDQCVVIIASHFDTKLISNGEYVGANDSASSSIMLLQMLRYLAEQKFQDLKCEIWFTWFDGEESMLPKWTDGETIHPAKQVDHTYGSRWFASRMIECPFEGRRSHCLPEEYGGAPVMGVIVVDMIGSPELRFTRELHSSPALRNLFQQAVTELGQESRLGPYREVEDDHIPFLKRGMYALNIIDFENLTHWHEPTDIAANLSAQSIEITAQIVSYLALSLAAEPQVILQITE